MNVRHFLALLVCLLLCTCGRGTEPAEAAPEAPTTTEEETPQVTAREVEPPSPYTTKDGELMGMKAGEPLADFKAGLREGVLSTGEGDFEVFYIDGAEGTELGYLMVDETGKEIMDITITSSDVMTEHGLAVGMTYAQLREKLGQVEVHGSEIEGYTHAQKDDYWYQLDAGNWSYEVDPSTLKPDTKILSIGLPR